MWQKIVLQNLETLAKVIFLQFKNDSTNGLVSIVVANEKVKIPGKQRPVPGQQRNCEDVGKRGSPEEVQ